MLPFQNTSQFNKLFRIQKWIVRIIYGVKKSSSCKPLFEQSKILTLPSIFILECSLFIKKGGIQIDYKKSHSYSTRYNSVISVKQHRTKAYEGAPHYKCIQIYNKLPNSIKSQPQPKFKYLLKNYLQEKTFYSVKEFLG